LVLKDGASVPHYGANKMLLVTRAALQFSSVNGSPAALARELDVRGIHAGIDDGAIPVAAQVPRLLGLLQERARAVGWTVGQVFFVRHCRVGVLNDVGEVLSPTVAVLLIGERPGLATAESLSAYLAHKPRARDTDAQRNLISNIHARGVPVEAAAGRILALAERMRQQGASGVGVKEELLGQAMDLLPPEKR
jgi:ethanolamine ammonia-lyase small subunit